MKTCENFQIKNALAEASLVAPKTPNREVVMPLQNANLPFWLENFSDPVLANKIANGITGNISEYKMAKDSCLCKPGVIVFDSKTPLQSTLQCIYNNRKKGNAHILAVCCKSKSIDKDVFFELYKAGIDDVYCMDTLPFAEEIISDRIKRWVAVEQLLNSSSVNDKIIGKSGAWLDVMREVIEVALYSSSSVLITGESGTGKELVSNLIHQLDGRSEKGQLTLVDCSTIVSDLSGSEFFGHEKGAFTNAVSSREGAFALANNGTLFLDEVGELPPSLQSELLRVVQEKVYKKVGSNIWKKTDFRLVSATNKNLMNEVDNKNFRQDLYYRISGWVIELPPLRERKEDIPDLVNFFAKQNLRNEYIEVDNSLMDYLQTRQYNGNIRELKQLVSRITMKHTGKGPLTMGLLPKEDLLHFRNQTENKVENSWDEVIRKSLLFGCGLKEMKEAVGNIAIKIAVDQENGNLQKAAVRLGVTDRSLQLWKSKGANNGNDVLI